ncbi:unnamed protein product [Schistocephalus solidus]|uniref:Reverse transcriptase domain-containing protein n=1 Tax=Schistocephalus solidus TaxID=70667 RepID=A0A183SBH2_SCHSO|nr:unnamed protein product [Schistocephalus solidus]
MARFNGLPKVHKHDSSLRPIISLRGTPTFNLANWLFRRLNCLIPYSDTMVRSAANFLERLGGLHLKADIVVVSFDVTSLFTSIPQSLAIETVGELLENRYDEGTVYEQIEGTPMGLPLSGFIAEAVLQKLETVVFTNHRPILWVRYVDDTFVVRKREMVAEFHALQNSIYPDIQFTMEAEVNSQMAFLDVLVHRKTDGSLRTTVYRNATNTRQALSYQSNHPLCHKRSCLRTLYKRVETHCSEKDDKASELHYFQRMFTSRLPS